MRIVFFSRLFFPHIGGVEKHVLNISERLVKKGFEVTVITEDFDLQKHSSEINGIKIIRISVGKEDRLKKFRIWWGLLKYLNVIAKADIVHCHDIFFWYLPFRFIFPFKKVYTTFHGYEGNFIPTKKAIIMHKMAEKLSLGNICIGSFFSKWYGTKPDFITYGAVDVKIIQEGKKNIKPNKDIVFIGRLEKETGIMNYISVINKLKKKRIYLGLDIFGDGSLRPRVEKYIQSNKLNINIKGFVENATDYLSDYKFVFVSRYLGILEAMALKKPIFALYNNKIKKDYLQMTDFSNFIVVSSNPDFIVEKLQKLSHQSSQVNLENGYSWVKKQNWNKMVSIYLKLWKIY